MDCGERFFTFNWNFFLECLTGEIPHRENSLEPDGWAVAAMNGPASRRRNGLRTLTKHREPPASGARVMQKDGLSNR